MLNGFRIGLRARMLAILGGLLAAGALALPLSHPAAQAEVPRVATPVECGIGLELTAPPPRCEIRTKDYSYTAKLVDGKLVVVFGDGKVCKLVSVKAITGTLNKDGVTMEAPLDGPGDGTIKADVIIKCGDNKFSFEGFRVTYDAQINEYDVDEGTFKPITEV